MFYEPPVRCFADDLHKRLKSRTQDWFPISKTKLYDTQFVDLLLHLWVSFCWKILTLYIVVIWFSIVFQFFIKIVSTDSIYPTVLCMNRCCCCCCCCHLNLELITHVRRSTSASSTVPLVTNQSVTLLNLWSLLQCDSISSKVGLTYWL